MFKLKAERPSRGKNRRRNREAPIGVSEKEASFMFSFLCSQLTPCLRISTPIFGLFNSCECSIV